MPEIIMTVMIVLCLFLILLLYLQHKNLRHIREQLTYTNREHSTFRFYSDSMDPEMKALCEEMQQLREYYMQESVRAMRMDHNFKHLITNISHDIRTPLTSISGYLQLLETAENEVEREHCFTVIRARMAYLQDLLEELFLYTRLSSASIEFHPEPVRIHDLLSEVLLHYYEDFKKQDLQVELDVDAMAVLKADPVYLKRMLHNLCVNVLRHGCGTLLITAKSMDQACELIFQNDVMDEVDAEAIFERFYTKNNAGTGRDTGLGLAIVKELCEGMQGSVFARLEQRHLQIHTIFPAGR